MMRVDLLRSVPAPAESPEPHKAPPGGPLKPVLIVLLLLLVVGTLTIWFVKPEWMKLDRAAGLWRGAGEASADSLRRAQAVAEQASRLVDQRQGAAIEWLHQLEPLLPRPEGPRDRAPIVMSLSMFTASGEFLLEGSAVSAEALSALQEAMVLVPGMDLRESRALEITGSAGPGFDFRFAGRVHPGGDEALAAADSAASADSGADSATATDSAEAFAAAHPVPVRNRVVDAAGLAAQLDTLRRTAAERGVAFAPSQAGPVTQSGGLNLHVWKLKGVWSPGAEATGDESAGASSLLVAVRELLELERHRGSPFAIQRVTLSEQRGQKIVFLDILALTP